MINKTEWDRMIQGKLYNPYKVGGNTFETVHAAQKKFNESEYWHDKSAFEELKKCFKSAPDDMLLTPPVYFDHGNRISFGKHFYANTDLTILDENYVTFGDNVFLAPHISIYTAGHPIDKDVRNLDLWKCCDQSRRYHRKQCSDRFWIGCSKGYPQSRSCRRESLSCNTADNGKGQR